MKKISDDDVFQKPGLFFGLCTVFLLFVALVAVAAFFIAVRGAEEVMVPDVQSKDIAAAVIEMQNKELDVRVQLRYSNFERGNVIEQDPKAGTIVKSGRKIRLVVSQGALLSNAGSYIGRNLDDVRSELRSLFGSSEQPLLKIKDPVLYQFSQEPAGTILEQDPVPGAGLSGPTEISFVVSKGSEAVGIEMPRVIGLGAEAAVRALDKAGARWTISLRAARSGETPMTVVAQDPSGGNSVPENLVTKITIAGINPAELGGNDAAGLFEHTLAENSYPMQTTLDVIYPTGERQTLVSVNHYGGSFTYPYRLPKESVLVLSLLGNREIYRETVR